MRQVRNSFIAGREIVTGWLLCLFGRHDWGRWHNYSNGTGSFRKCMREGRRVFEKGSVCE